MTSLSPANEAESPAGGRRAASRKLSLDEIHALITEIALSGEGADRFRALKLLQAEKATDATLPKPLNGVECVRRLARLMRGAGRKIARAAFLEAFPEPGPKLEGFPETADDLGLKMEELPKSLKVLYQRYPELKRPGFPPTFPVGGSVAAKVKWVQAQAVQAEIERRRDRIEENLAGIQGMGRGKANQLIKEIEKDDAQAPPSAASS